MCSMSTQEKERYYFELFAKTYRLPHGTVEHGDQPDVILRGERTIGIEMRNFFLEEGFLPQSEQVQRKLREEVVAEAQRIYEIKHGRRGDEFVFGFEIPISEKQKLANQIADLADRVVDKQTRQIRRN